MTVKQVLYDLQQVHRWYESSVEVVKAVDGVDLQIFKGDFIAVFGPSGSGKTTFLNLLAGLDKATGGSIVFNDVNLNDLSDSAICDLRRHEIGIIFQFYNMHPSLTTQENVEYPMLIAGIPASQRSQRATELLKEIGLLDKKDNFPAELSGGEKQRVGIARALTNEPQVIIADEPTGDLDSENAEEIINLLLSVNKQGTTIVMVTHDESLLTEDMRILHLIDGKIFG
ncbi:MAG: ABC transporter ATP-binding protein [Candidatus Heimdallarchaeota archaeon]|nr:MAG: ABC transporter ATP-binding protein [Candidatus Heimdallarchaeota archaeon]